MSIICLRTNAFWLAGLAACFIALFNFANTLHGQQLDQVLAHIDDQTSVVVRINPAILDALIGNATNDNNDLEQTVLQARLKKTRDILGDDPVWLTTGFPRTPLAMKILLRDPNDERIKKLKELWDVPKRPDYGPEPQVVIRSWKDFDDEASVDSARLDQWKKFITSFGDNGTRKDAIQFGCLPPANLYETYRELLTELPDYLGGGPITVLTDGLQRVSGTIDFETGELGGTISSSSPEAAAQFADQATDFLASLPQVQQTSLITELKHRLREHLQRSTLKPDKSQIRWTILASDDWQPKKLLELAVGSQSNRSAAKQLKKLALGILNYESGHRCFPPPQSPEGPSGLSWRVHVLPFLNDDGAKLYKKFALDEPWDSPTNIKLLPQMPDIFSKYGSKLLAPSATKTGYTTVVAPSSENTILGAPKKVTFRSITDGSSNTILLVIVKDSLAVPWTAPQDYVFDPKQPAAGLQFTDGKVPVAFCDGHTALISKDNDAKTWVGTFEMNDGEISVAK